MFRFGRTAEPMEPPLLTGYAPMLSLQGLQLGVDNLRHDVHLSRGFVEKARLHLSRLITQHGNVEGLLAAETPQESPPSYFARSTNAKNSPRPEPMELKPLLTELHLGALESRQGSGKSRGGYHWRGRPSSSSCGWNSQPSSRRCWNAAA